MDDSWRRKAEKMIEAAQRKLDESQRELNELKECIRGAAPAGKANPESTNGKGGVTVRRRRRTTCSMIIHTLILLHGKKKHEALIENHPDAVDLGTGKTLIAFLKALADPVVGDDRGDGLVPVKRPWELIPLLRRLGLRSEINGGLLRAHIKRLRDAFEAARLDRGLIETVGEGYRLRAAIDRQLEERDGTA